MKKFAFVPLILTLGFLAAGCSRGNTQKAGVAPPVLTARVVETNLPVLVDPAPVGHVMPVSIIKLFYNPSHSATVPEALVLRLCKPSIAT